MTNNVDYSIPDQSLESPFFRLLETVKESLIRYIAMRIYPNSRDVDDIYQQVIIRGWIRIDQCTDTEHFAAWIFTIARNEICRHTKKYKKREQQHEQYCRDMEGAIDSKTKALDPCCQMMAEESLREAHVIYQALPNNLRDIFFLRHVECRTIKEIATLEKISETSVYNRLKKAEQIISTVFAVQTNFSSEEPFVG